MYSAVSQAKHKYGTRISEPREIHYIRNKYDEDICHLRLGSGPLRSRSGICGLECAGMRDFSAHKGDGY